MSSRSICTLILCLVTFCAGCARTTAVGPAENRGVIYLSMSGGQWHPPGEVTNSRGLRSPFGASSVGKKVEGPQKFTIISLKDDNGRIVGRRVIPVFYGEILMHAIEQQLDALGYTVKVAPKVPADGDGVDISRVAADLEQSSGLLALEGKCALQATVEVWRNGNKISGRSFQSEIADYAVADQDQLHFRLMEEASRKIAADGMAAGLTAVP